MPGDVFEDLGQALLDKVRGVVACRPVPVTDPKQVAVGRLVEVGAQYEAVLVHLVRIVRDEADPSREGILRDDVALDIEWVALVERQIASLLSGLVR